MAVSSSGRAEEGAPDMSGCKKECWHCHSSRPLLHRLVETCALGKGQEGQSCQGTLEQCFFSSTDEDKAASWPQRSWALTQNTRVGLQPDLSPALLWPEATYLCSRKDLEDCSRAWDGAWCACCVCRLWGWGFSRERTSPYCWCGWFLPHLPGVSAVPKMAL